MSQHLLRTSRLPIVVVLLLIATAAHAKGPPSKAILSGPGLAAPVVVADRELLDALQMGAIMDFTQPVAAPEGSQRYRLDYYYRAGDESEQLAFAVEYQPHPGGERGYIYHLSDPQQSWYRASAAGEAALQQILAQQRANGAAPQQPVAQPLPAAATAQPLPAAGATLLPVVSLLLLGAALLGGKRLLRRGRRGIV